MSNAYAPCHCLPDSAGYLGLVELFVRRRCQIARRLSGQSDQPDELDTSLVSCAYSNSARGFRQYINGRANPAVCLFCCFERSITDAYPSPARSAGTKIRCNCLSQATTPTLKSAVMRSQSTNGARFSGRTSGFRKIRRHTAARATSSKSGSRVSTAMSVAAIRNPRAAFQKSRCAGCSRRP